jgi:tetratricopeptide (TPR) repeat protein
LPAVARDFGQGPEPGRFIHPRAYAAFALGRDAEASGQLERALEAYGMASAADPSSATAHTRRGAVACKLGRVDEARSAFAEAIAAGPRHAAAREEWARCELAEGRAKQAWTQVERGLGLDPTSVALTLLGARALEADGRGAEAAELLHARTLLGPPSLAVTERLAEVARPLRPALAEAAAREAARLRAAGVATPGEAPAARPRGERASMERALAAGDLATARRVARDQRIPLPELVLRAVTLGRAADVLELARTLSQADPDSAAARVAYAAAAERAGGPDPATILGDAPVQPSTDLGRTGRLALAGLLLRRVGKEASDAALGPGDLTSAEAMPDDDLVARLRAALK